MVGKNKHGEGLLRRTTLIGLFCTSLLIGLALAHRQHFNYPIASFCSLLVIGMWRRVVLLVPALVLCGISLGGLRGTMVQQKLVLYQVLQKQQITIVGRAVDDAVYGKHTQLAFDLHKTTAPALNIGLPGKIGVSGFGVNSVNRNDIVYATGKLALGQGGHQAWMSFATLSVTHTSPSIINRVRQRFNAGL
jgi:hypothetical protein